MRKPYTPIRRVTRFHEELPVRLILQTRHYVEPVDFFACPGGLPRQPGRVPTGGPTTTKNMGPDSGRYRSRSLWHC